MAAEFRRAGYSVELFASGSPRKRYDKARKANPEMLVSFDVRDGKATQSFSVLNLVYAKQEDAVDLFARRWVEVNK